MQATKSNLSIFQMRAAAWKSIKLITAEMMMAERMAFGVYLKRGVMNISVRKTTADITMFDIAVWHPAI